MQVHSALTHFMVLLLSTNVDPRGETLELLLTKHHLTSFLHFPELPDDNFLSWLLISKMLPAQLPLNTHRRSNVHSQQYVSGVYDSWCAIAGLFPSACFPLWELLHHRWDSSSTCRWKSTALSESSFEFVPQVQLWLLCLYDSEETVLYFNLVIKNQIKWAVLQLGFKAVAF